MKNYYDESFRASSTLTNVSSSEFSNFDISNRANMNEISRYLNLSDDDNECNYPQLMMT